MRAKLHKWFDRLESLSVREQALVMIGLPVALAVTAEGLIFSPARDRAAAVEKQVVAKRNDLLILQTLLAVPPATDTLPAADQLQSRLDLLRGQIESARAITQRVSRSVDWGMVVRGTAAGTPGLTLTSLKAMPPELAFDPAKVKPPEPARKPGAQPPPPKPAASSAGLPLVPAPGVGDLKVYRHKGELKVNGDFQAVIRFLQTLQTLPGELHWDKLQLDTAQYPAATAHMTLHILSTRPDTPFN